MISAAAAKMLGAFFKIPLTNMLGGVGMSYFSCAYSLFMPVYAFAVTGISSAAARMTARSASTGNIAEIRRIRSTALLVFSLMGLAGSVIIFLSAKPFRDLPCERALRRSHQNLLDFHAEMCYNFLINARKGSTLLQ